MKVKIEKYSRIGTWMGVVQLSEGYRKVNSDGKINMEEAIKILKDMRFLFDEVKQKM